MGEKWGMVGSEPDLKRKLATVLVGMSPEGTGPRADSGPRDLTSSLPPARLPSSWPEVSPRTPQLFPAGFCRKPGVPGQWGQLKRKKGYGLTQEPF